MRTRGFQGLTRVFGGELVEFLEGLRGFLAYTATLLPLPAGTLALSCEEGQTGLVSSEQGECAGKDNPFVADSSHQALQRRGEGAAPPPFSLCCH